MMAETIQVPVTAAGEVAQALESHEAIDAAQHAQIAQTEDEDYKWLTDRLDAHQTQVAELKAQVTALETLLQTNQEQSRTLIAAQSEMITKLLESVTAMSESALLKSNLSNLESSSPVVEKAPVEVKEVVKEVVPEKHEAIGESSGEGEPKKKRQRI